MLVAHSTFLLLLLTFRKVIHNFAFFEPAEVIYMNPSKSPELGTHDSSFDNVTIFLIQKLLHVAL